jgi:putative ABC transport system permease protein
LGGDKLFVSADSNLGSVGEGTTANPLDKDDVAFLENQPGVKSVTYLVLGSARVEYRDTIKFLQVIAVPTDSPDVFNDYFNVWTYPVMEGRELQRNDKFTVAVGWQHGYRNIWDGDNLRINDKLAINGKTFRVGGIYEPTGSAPDDRTLQITDSAYEEVIGEIDRVDQIIVTVTDENQVDEISEQLTRSLARFRNVRTGNEDFTIETPLDLLSSFQNILDIVQAVLIGIAGISLFVGGVGIMNTMYTAVVERKKDIGIMKAIGATNRDIFLLFFFESGLLGLVGGVIGIIFGAGLAWLVEFISTQALGRSFLQAYFSWELFVGAVLFSFIVGALAGTLPAYQASKEQAADTLRDE